MTLETSIDELGRTALRIKRNHDALLAAARGMVGALDNYDGVESVIVRAIDDLRAAIQEAQA